MRVRQVVCLPALVLALVLAACTDSPEPDGAGGSQEQAEPDPEPDAELTASGGMSVAVVLPSTDEVDASLQQVLAEDLQRLQDEAEEVQRLRIDVADGHQFVPDLAQLHAERGVDLVCVMGGQGPMVVSQLVERYGGVQFCTPAPAAVSSDEEDMAPGELGVRAEELGHVLGVAARVAADGAPVATVLDGDDLPEYRFQSGLVAGLAGTPVIESVQGESMADRARNAVDAGAEVVVIDGGPGAVTAVEEVAEDALVLAPQAVADAADAPVLVTWQVTWVQVLSQAFAQWSDGGEPESASLGLEQEIFAVSEDVSQVSDEVGEDVERAIRVSTRELIAGEREATTASPGSLTG